MYAQFDFNYTYICFMAINTFHFNKIPWDVSQNDVRNFFGNCRIPPSSSCSQSIHVSFLQIEAPATINSAPFNMNSPFLYRS